MSDRNNEPSSMQSMFSQILKDIQTGISRLEQSVAQPSATEKESAGSNGFPPPENSEFTPGQTQSNPTPKPAAAPFNGPRWEYKVVYVNFRGQISSEGEQIVIGRGERRSSFVRQSLDELGQQGWELTGVSPLGETENSYFVFKRPAGLGTTPSTPDAVSVADEVPGTVAQL